MARYKKELSLWRVDLGGINNPGTSKTFAWLWTAKVYAWILIKIARRYCEIQEVATYKRVYNGKK